MAYYCIYMLNKFFLFLNHQVLQDLYKEDIIHMYLLIIVMELFAMPLLMVGLRARNNDYYTIMCIYNMMAFLCLLIAQYYYVQLFLYFGILFIILEAKSMYYVIKNDCELL